MSSSKALYCAAHGFCRHTTAQCFSPRKPKASYSAHKPTYKALSTSTSPSRPPATTTVQTPPTCFRCNEKGHYANKCPTNESSVKARRAWFREHDRNLSHNDLEELEVPIQLNHHHTSALIDTGANRSFVTRALAEQMDLGIHPASGEIELAVPVHTIPRIGHTDPVQMTCGEEIIDAQFEILEDLNGLPVFISTDVLSRLHLQEHGLPYRFGDAVIPGNAQIDPLTPVVEYDTDLSSDNEPTEELRNKATQIIQPELDENASI